MSDLRNHSENEMKSHKVRKLLLNVKFLILVEESTYWLQEGQLQREKDITDSFQSALMDLKSESEIFLALIYVIYSLYFYLLHRYSNYSI